MRADLCVPAFEKVRSGEALAVLTDGLGNVIWETDKSPVSGLYRAYFENQLNGFTDMILYAGQAGIAMGILAGKIPIRECHAVKMSEGGIRMFKEGKVSVTCKETIPFVKSSKDETKICPIEQFLHDHADSGERWEFLERHYKQG